MNDNVSFEKAKLKAGKIVDILFDGDEAETLGDAAFTLRLVTGYFADISALLSGSEANKILKDLYSDVEGMLKFKNQLNSKNERLH